MQNLDVTAIAKLAESTLQLVTTAPDNTQEAFETDVSKWVTDTEKTVKELGVSNKVNTLIQTFSLDHTTTALVLYALLPSIDARFNTYFGKIKNDNDSPEPSIDLLESLVTTSYEAKNQLNTKLEDDSPVFVWKMLRRVPGANFPDSKVMPSRDLVLHLAEEGTLDKDKSGLVTQIVTPELTLPFDKVNEIPEARIITVNGGFPARQQSYAFKLAETLRQPLYGLNNTILSQSDDPVGDLREALLFVTLNNGVLYWPDGSPVLNDNPSYLPVIDAWLQLQGTRLIIGETKFKALPQGLSQNSVDTIQLVKQDRQMDQLIWQSEGEKELGVTNIDYSALNNRYATYYPRIRATILRVKQLQNANQTLSTRDVEESYVATSPVSLAGMAKLDRTNFSFDDMVLTEPVQKAISSIEKAYLNRVMLDPSQPSGVVAIFEGAVGTGKTMAAESLGNDLGLPVYRIDYAVLLDQAGDLEVTLSDLFDEAEKNSACLLFDEADALFAKKKPDGSSVNNLTTAYLIQRIEQYNGLIILTTNQKPKIDKAIFTRAMVVVTFPPFKPQQRYDLFVKILANMGVTVESRVNLKELMKVLGANGHQVKNIINNAVLSASEGNVPLDEIVIAAKDLGRAIELESNK